MTECTCEQLEFHGLGRRVVVAGFDGGAISSDSGVLLLREVEAKTGLLTGVAEQFTDYRNPELIEHSVGELASQPIIRWLDYADPSDVEQPDSVHNQTVEGRFGALAGARPADRQCPLWVGGLSGRHLITLNNGCPMPTLGEWRKSTRKGQ